MITRHFFLFVALAIAEATHASECEIAYKGHIENSLEIYAQSILHSR